MERDLPKAINEIDGKNILGFMKEKEMEDTCILNVGEDRKPKDIQPGLVFIAVPCPENCDQCIVTKYGSLKCTVPSSGFKLQMGKVVQSCQAEGYVEMANVCYPCSTNGGCKTCTVSVVDNKPKMVCSACFASLGYALETVTVNGTQMQMCNQKQCLTDPTKYYNNGQCVDCTANCALCKDGHCMKCKEDFAMMINSSNMARTCLADCGDGYYVDEHHMCRKCDESCSTCVAKGPDACLSCKVAGKKLVPVQKIRIMKNNAESDFDVKNNKTETADFYEEDPDMVFPGSCQDECMMNGIALFENDAGECELCKPHG